MTSAQWLHNYHFVYYYVHLHLCCVLKTYVWNDLLFYRFANVRKAPSKVFFIRITDIGRSYIGYNEICQRQCNLRVFFNLYLADSSLDESGGGTSLFANWSRSPATIFRPCEKRYIISSPFWKKVSMSSMSRLTLQTILDRDTILFGDHLKKKNKRNLKLERMMTGKRKKERNHSRSFG